MKTSCRQASLMQYPQRFEFVSKAAKAPTHEGISMSNDGLLMLYTLYKQATEGDCSTEQPSMWHVTEYAKWKCWSAIKGMGKMEAMHKYVKTVEEEKPDIWESVAKEIDRSDPSHLDFGDTPHKIERSASGSGEVKKDNDDIDLSASQSSSLTMPNSSFKGNEGVEKLAIDNSEEVENKEEEEDEEKKKYKITLLKDKRADQGKVKGCKSQRFPGTTRKVGALLALMQDIENNPKKLSLQVPSCQEVLQTMLRTKALLNRADQQLKDANAEEIKLEEHLTAFSPRNMEVEPDSGSFSHSSISASKKRAELLVTKGQQLLNELQEHIEGWRRAIREELDASQSDGDMLGDRGSFGFQAIACLLPLKRRTADTVARWIKLDIKFGAMMGEIEAAEDDSLCTIS